MSDEATMISGESDMVLAAEYVLTLLSRIALRVSHRCALWSRPGLTISSP
jgi:hypothetical protein